VLSGSINLKFTVCSFQERGEKQKKINEKWEFLGKIDFYFWYNFKQTTIDS